MLVIKIELWPGGDQKRAKTIGIGKIGNDATGDCSTGNYNATLFSEDKTLWKKGRVEGFPRKLTAWDLLYRVLKNLVSDRNEPV